MKRSLFVLAMATYMLVFGTSAYATIIKYSASLSGANESPANASAGTGTAIVTLDDILDTMRVEVTFSGLSGTTTTAHIHCCVAAPGSIGVASTTPTFAGFPLGVTAGSYDNTLDMTLASSYNPSFITIHGGTAADAEAFLFTRIALGESYCNIHTTAFGGGEIRGFLTRVVEPIPEPATLALIGFGLVGLGWSRRHKV